MMMVCFALNLRVNIVYDQIILIKSNVINKKQLKVLWRWPVLEIRFGWLFKRISEKYPFLGMKAHQMKIEIKKDKK